MTLGSWSIVQPPSLIALIPLIIMIAMAIRGKNNISACFVGIVAGALIMGQDVTKMAALFHKCMGSTTVLIGVIIMLGAGLGALMTECRVTHTLVFWIVKGIGVNTQTKGKIALMISSIMVCGLLGTMGGGNAVIAPIMIPILGSLGVTPTVVATLMKLCGEIGLTMGPLTGVTLITMEVTGLSYGQLMVGAVLPFAFFFLGGAWFGVIRAQKRTEGKEAYEINEDVKSVSNFQATPRERNATIAFLLTFIALVIYGIITKQKTNYAVIVMIVLASVVAIMARVEIDRAVKSMSKGIASQAPMMIMFIGFEMLLNLVSAGGGFKALADYLSSFAGDSPTMIMLVAAIVGGFGIEAAAVAEIKIIAEMFGATAQAAGLPMSMFAISILAATRLTGSIYPTTNFAIAIGVAQCTNTKEVLQACWIACASVCVFILVWSVLGVRLLT